MEKTIYSSTALHHDAISDRSSCIIGQRFTLGK
ncbi:hypothetical protein Vi05172_g5214 [Venturia inaequalis]|nr:hypothetical protein Vi05172_g5214 [Venturia inaequalis]